MATWTNITNAALEPGKPIRSVDGLALRDNVTALAEGASGAPKIVNAAVTNGTLGAEKFQTGTTERDWVLARTALGGIGSVGTYALIKRSDPGGSDDAPGDTRAGSDLRYASTGGTSIATVISGTWRCMGVAERSGQPDANRTTVWLRIS